MAFHRRPAITVVATIILWFGSFSALGEQVSKRGQSRASAVPPIELSESQAWEILIRSPEFHRVDRILAQDEGRIDPESGLDAADIEGISDEICLACDSYFPPEFDPATGRLQAFRYEPQASTVASGSKTEPPKYRLRELGYRITVIRAGPHRVRLQFFWYYGDRLPVVVARYTGQAGRINPESWRRAEWMADPSYGHTGEADLIVQGGSWKIRSLRLAETGRVPFAWTDELRGKLRDYRGRIRYHSWNATCPVEELLRYNIAKFSANDNVSTYSQIDVWDTHVALDERDELKSVKLGYAVIKDVAISSLPPNPLVRECVSRLRLTTDSGRAYDILGDDRSIKTAKRAMDEARQKWFASRAGL